ncbi:Signal transduction histidine kinase [Arthrobacter alpinus]|uniref:histidine kinase n=1 Tax=Arthrobacter alpinus TaxID=656366 RepID=A0A1H5KGC4_9MICC|nr:ATP-binding protein [Arthrobacter alpinus]SEE63872.1 Signal transduction histidine kinase [Arthrobacter alpinus]
MTHTEVTKPSGRHFFRLQGERKRVFLTQLPLSLIMVVAVLIAVAIYPQSFKQPLFLAALVMHVLLLAASLAIPWERFSPSAVLIIPYLDFVAIGLFRGGNQQFLTAVGLLIFFPVFWLASSGLAKRTAVTVSVVAALLIVWLPVMTAPDGFTLEELARPLLFPIVVLAYATTVVAVTNTMNVQRKALEAKDVQLRAALEASQQRERLLETVVDTVAVGLVVVDGGGNDMLMNATQRKLHAYALPENIDHPKEKDLLVFATDAITPVPADERPVLRAIRGEEFTNYQVWLGSGEKARAVSTAARPMLDEQGTFHGAVIAFHDVTDMMAALAAKNDFVANVSHEFRTPLTSIQGYLEMALEDSDELPPDVLTYLTIASRNVDRLSSLVSDLLTTDSMSLELTRTNVARLVAESLASAAPSAEHNKVTLNSQVQEPLEALIDTRRIGQVLDNLISNAVKYSPDGGTVTVRTWAEGADLWCEVQDTGIGMNSSEQAQAFTKFFRARTAVQRSIPGIGLGLMITKTIIAKHGGTISLESERNVGTTIRFVLPGCLGTGGRTVGLGRISQPELEDAP